MASLDLTAARSALRQRTVSQLPLQMVELLHRAFTIAIELPAELLEKWVVTSTLGGFRLSYPDKVRLLHSLAEVGFVEDSTLQYDTFWSTARVSIVTGAG